ncbi:MAG: hypothetical protein ACK5PS_05315 [Desulfopila sp.]
MLKRRNQLSALFVAAVFGVSLLASGCASKSEQMEVSQAQAAASQAESAAARAEKAASDAQLAAEKAERIFEMKMKK